MPTITLPDGAQRSYDSPLSGADIAADISKSLAKKAIAVTIDGALMDLDTTVDRDAEVAIITREGEEALELTTVAAGWLALISFAMFGPA
ncbi:MAG: TGS domain-containing protein, partial [Pseudomonadota bacterium]